MSKLQVNNLVRISTFFQHAGISIVFVFMPIIGKGVTDSIFEIGLLIASFSFAQILSEIYFGRYSGKKGTRLKFIRIGFIGCATDKTAHLFENTKGLGTMPHALIGYAGSTLKAAEMFNSTWPDEPLTVLIDYFGKEITDGLMVCRTFKKLADKQSLSLRIDTHGGRYIEGLDVAGSYAVLERNAPQAIRGYRTEQELRYLIGTGVSAAAVWHLREMLDNAGFEKVKIVASSGFGPEKCKVFALANVPVDVIGTGSYLPSRWSETYATADIISYGGKSQVKLGREFLLRR